MIKTGLLCIDSFLRSGVYLTDGLAFHHDNQGSDKKAVAFSMTFAGVAGRAKSSLGPLTPT